MQLMPAGHTCYDLSRLRTEAGRHSACAASERACNVYAVYDLYTWHSLKDLMLDEMIVLKHRLPAVLWLSA